MYDAHSAVELEALAYTLEKLWSEAGSLLMGAGADSVRTDEPGPRRFGRSEGYDWRVDLYAGFCLPAYKTNLVRREAVIHLRLPLPTPSSGLPGSSGEQPSNTSCLTLLRVGFT